MSKKSVKTAAFNLQLNPPLIQLNKYDRHGYSPTQGEPGKTNSRPSIDLSLPRRGWMAKHRVAQRNPVSAISLIHVP